MDNGKISGQIAWWEIRVPDMDPAKAFYSTVFDATAIEPFEGYVMLAGADGQPFGALEATTEPVPSDSYQRTYFSTDDLEATLAGIELAGGTVDKPRELISEEFGWWAQARDPFGNRLGLCTSKPAAG